MKFIITESQLNLIELETKSDILYKLIEKIYPNMYEYETSHNTTDVYENEDNSNLLFYYNWDKKEFYIGANFIENLFDMTQLSFLNIDGLMKDKKKERIEFDELIKVFAKRHYGWIVDKVWFHWY